MNLKRLTGLHKVSDARRISDSDNVVITLSNVYDNGYDDCPVSEEELRREFHQYFNYWNYFSVFKEEVERFASKRNLTYEFSDWGRDGYVYRLLFSNEEGQGVAAINFYVLQRFDEGTLQQMQNVIKPNISDSVRRVKDSLDEDNEYLLEHIGDLLEEGYRSGYDPQWDLDITVDSQDISEFNDDDKDLIYQDIAYVVKDGYDNYQGIETELSDGSIVYVDFVLNY